MGVEDDDLSELERRMRAKLFADKGPHNVATLSEEERRVARKLIGEGRQNAHALSDAEQRMAERLVGIDNAKRFTTAKEGRRVRPLPVRISYEWYWFRFNTWGHNEQWRWRINRIENGHRRETHAEGWDDDELGRELKALRAKGIHPVDANPKKELPQRKERKVSKRKAIINSLRFYRP